MFQNRTIIFEKADIEAMKRGEVISIKQSDGSQLDFAYDRIRKPSEKVGQASGNGLSQNQGPSSRETILEFLKLNGPAKIRDIVKASPHLTYRKITAQLYNLKSREKVISQRDDHKYFLPRGQK